MSPLMDSRKNRSSSTTATKVGFGIRSPTLRSNPPNMRHQLFVVFAGEFDNRNLRPRVPPGNAMPHKFWFSPRREFRNRAPGMQPNHSYSAVSARKPWSMPRKSYGGKGGYSRPQIGITL